jgi:hypothetical protein
VNSKIVFIAYLVCNAVLFILIQNRARGASCQLATSAV